MEESMRKSKIATIFIGILLVLMISGCASTQVKAARKGDLDALQKYLDDGGDINAREKGGTTLLMYAAENGQNPTITFLLDRGAIINLKDDRGKTAFLYGVTARKESSALLLLQRGASVNTLLPSGDSALTLASGGENLSMVKMLIENGADLNQTNNNGWSSLTIALSRDAQRPAKLSSLTNYLIGLNANIDIPSPEVDKIAFSAAASGNNEVLNYLLGLGYDLESRNSKNETLLMTAIVAQKTETVKMLLKKGADWSVQDSSGWSALMKSLYVSASKGQKPDAIALILMEYGATVEGGSPQGIETAFAAAAHGSSEILKLLLENSLAPTVKNNQNNTLLMAGIKHISVVNLMIGYQVPINTVNAQGMSALLLASENGNVESLTSVILAGADLNQKDKTGQSALFYTARSGNVELSRKLLVAGISVFGTDKEGNTPLHAASEKGVPETVRLLLTAGIYVDSSNSKGETPLILSDKNSKYSIEIRQILITAGAKVPVVEVAPQPAPVLTPKPSSTAVQTTPVIPVPVVTPAPVVVTTPPVAASTPESEKTPVPVDSAPVAQSETETPVPLETVAPEAQVSELKIHISWPAINPSAVRGWNNSDKLTGKGIIQIGYKESSSWFYDNQINIPMKGVNADRFEMDILPGAESGKPCKAILTLPTKKGSLVAEITAIPDLDGKLNLYFDNFKYEK
jgi:ankyrin repeat protein